MIIVTAVAFRRRGMLMVEGGDPCGCHRRDEQPVDGVDDARCCGRVVHGLLLRCRLRMAKA
ncbi:hypothetical protein [Bradyrhizobium sp. USDA 313]|uniref:hypothetical protein n=1 Tax=Bradyrhizobium sp. USDA 313 TaxID=3156307 RepID=UPI003515BB1E